jgi:hypothetical protein
MRDDLSMKPYIPRRPVSPFVGKQMTISSSRRLVTALRDKATIRLWKASPDAIRYLHEVALGKAEYVEGRFRACVAILGKTMPNVSAQLIVSDATSLNADVKVPPSDALLARLESVERLTRLANDLETGRVLPSGDESSDGRD